MKCATESESVVACRESVPNVMVNLKVRSDCFPVVFSAAVLSGSFDQGR